MSRKQEMSLGAAIFWLVVAALWFSWSVYFTIKLAQHIGAWPFA